MFLFLCRFSWIHLSYQQFLNHTHLIHARKYLRSKTVYKLLYGSWIYWWTFVYEWHSVIWSLKKKKKKTKREKKVVLIVFSAASQILQTRSFNPCCFYLYIHIQQKKRKSLFFFLYIFSHNKKWGFNPHSFHHPIHHHFCFFPMLIQSVCAVLSTSLRRSVVWLFVNLLGVSSFLWILSLALHCR